MITKRLALIAGLLVLTAVPAQAVILTYNVESDYTAAVGAELFFINFDGLTPGPADGDFAGQVDFGSPDAVDPTQVAYGSDALTDAGSTFLNMVGPVDGIFDSPVNAFGLEFSSSGLPQTVELYDGTGTLFGSVVTNPGGFFGVLSDQSISKFVIRNGQSLVPIISNDRFFVDNFRANAASAVPEPGTIFLLGTGLAGLGAAYRRRKH